MEEQASYDYAKFPRAFVSYRWFKPILVALLAAAFYLAFSVVLMIVATALSGNIDFLDTVGVGYDDMDAYTAPGALVELGSLATILPSLALAALIVRDRPFSSYSSSRGGWNWGAFGKCLLVAVAVMAVDFVVEYLIDPTMAGDGVNRFTAAGFVLCVALVPFQCLAEEYVFRGFLLQAFGSWTKLPAVGIVVSAVLFAAGHPYNMIGVVGIFCNGLIWGYVAWRTRGLEATSAIHIVNNMVAFLASGAGLGASTSEVTVDSLVVMLIVDVAYAAAVLLLAKKFDWFAPKGDAVAAFNERKRADLERKQRQREARKNGQPQNPEPPSPR